MADPATLATCAQVLELSAHYVTLAEAYDESFERLLIDSREALVQKVWVAFGGDRVGYYASLHDGLRAAMALEGAEFATRIPACIEMAGDG